MRAKAKHWVNYNATWHMQGETFEIDKADSEEMKLYAELIEDDEPPADEPPADEPKEPAKRGRKRKAETEE